MSRTFISQYGQIFASEVYNDWVSPSGISLVSGSMTLEDDLNALRTQVRQALWASDVSGSWYDGISIPSGGAARGINALNSSLTTLERKNFLYRAQNVSTVSIPTGSNVVILTSSLGQTPTSPMAVGSTTVTGSVVALHEGMFGAHAMSLVSGSTVINAKNLVVIRDANTLAPITDPSISDREIYGLIQVESGTATGDTFNDTNHQAQISFVVENPALTLTPADASVIGGRTINYTYVKRVDLLDIPEDAYMSDTIFMDPLVVTNAALLSDITLNRAIDQQSGAATQQQNITVSIDSGYSWTFASASSDVWKVSSNNAGNSLTTTVSDLSFYSANTSTFSAGMSLATGSTTINLGVAAGTIATLASNNMVLSGGALLQFSDAYGPTSTYTGGKVPFASSGAEWNTFFSDYGTSSVLNAFNQISASLLTLNAKQRTRYNAGVTANVTANTNITFPTNLDATLGDYSLKNFSGSVNIYLNGVLMLPGANSGAPNDVYPGTTLTSGDIKFPFSVRSGSQIAMEIF